MKSIKVSVVMITYGHEEFIEQAIQSVLDQVCNFDLELIIANDKSPDKTNDIVLKFLEIDENSRKIVYLNRLSNIGMMPNFLDALQRADGDYIAICEGDDFWTDNYKLQKQVDALEKNKNYSLCFHNSKVVYQNSDKKPYLFNDIDQKTTLYFDDLIERWQMATASMLFRNCIKHYPSWFSLQYNGDMALQFLLIGYGPFLYLEDLMCVYRIHDKGISNTKNTAQISNIRSIIRLLEIIDDHYNGEHHVSIKKHTQNLKKMMRNVSIKNKFPVLQKFRLFLKRTLMLIGDKL